MTTANNPENQNSKAAQGSGQIKFLTDEDEANEAMGKAIRAIRGSAGNRAKSSEKLLSRLFYKRNYCA